MRLRRCRRRWRRWSSWPRPSALSTGRGGSCIRRVVRPFRRSRRCKTFGVNRCQKASVIELRSNGQHWFSGLIGRACRPWFARECGLSSRGSQRCRSRAGRHRRGSRRQGSTAEVKVRVRVARRWCLGGCGRVVGGARIQAGLNPAKGSFAGAKTGMPIPGARRRAWSLRDCRRAGTFQATLAERHPDRRFACRKSQFGDVVGVWVAVSTHRITSFSPSRSA